MSNSTELINTYLLEEYASLKYVNGNCTNSFDQYCSDSLSKLAIFLKSTDDANLNMFTTFCFAGSLGFGEEGDDCIYR